MRLAESLRNITWKAMLRATALVITAGIAFYCAEQWGNGAMSRLSDFVASEGRTGILIFIGVNALATMFLCPQSPFTVMAGALFGWKLGTGWASIGMTLGALGSFCIARYGIRERLRARFMHNTIFCKLQQLSQKHPVHVISLSRLIPVIPFPLASYMLGVTQVRSLSYVLLTWLCMIPETLFLASGGHLLHSGITGHASIEAAVALGVAGVGLGVAVHRMKKRFLESASED